ncbi:MAG: DUF5305 domain-containing protein [Firmicutes bacterium]|nr:DUF5305 domain-containing protein [Bacillota bacterium]
MSSHYKKVLPFCLALLLFFTVLTVRAFLANPDHKEEAIVGEASQAITFNYEVYAKPSILYPEGGGPLPLGEQGFPLSIVDTVDFTVTADISNTSAHRPEGQLDIKLFLRSVGQWEKELELTPEISKTELNDKTTTYQSTFALPLEDAVKLAEEIIEEIKIRPREDYKLVVQSTISNMGGEPLLGECEFALGGGVISSSSELLYTEQKDITDIIISANSMNIFGFTLSVARARIAFLSLTLTLLLVMIGYILYLQRKGINPFSLKSSEFKKILKKHGSRIMEVVDFKEFPVDYYKVQLHRFKDLLKVADEREKPVLRASVNALKVAYFYVVDEKTVYILKLSME